jgi:hypothetical protein
MHMHASTIESMRTTVEITAPQRAQLLELAAQRGEKGFSKLVQEALDRYLAEQAHRREQIAKALATQGSLSEESAERLAAAMRSMRAGRWR